MTEETSLALKYRPKNLSDFIAKPEFKSMIQDIINDQPKAIMLTGEMGTGKTTLARMIASKVASEENIREINIALNGLTTDIHDAVFWANTNLGTGGKNVLIIDECHRLTKITASALLKETEDCQTCMFIFCTNTPESLLSTLVQRCIVIDTNRAISEDLMCQGLENILKKEGQPDCDNLKYLCEAISKSTSSMREALKTVQTFLYNNKETWLGLTKEDLIKEVQRIISTGSGLIPENTYSTILLDYAYSGGSIDTMQSIMEKTPADQLSTLYTAVKLNSRVFSNLLDMIKGKSKFSSTYEYFTAKKMFSKATSEQQLKSCLLRIKKVSWVLEKYMGKVEELTVANVIMAIMYELDTSN